MQSSKKNLLRLRPVTLALAGLMALSHSAVLMADEPAKQEEDAKSRPDVIRLSPVVVSATRVEQSSFDVPASIDALDKNQIQDGQPQVNLSETLVRVPGVVVQNRQNYAQDLQVSSRGFGSRAAFGVRGVRLIADGIPATNPDGQGQAATFDLGSAQRIEVLRGPYSALYGSSSGGVIQVFTEDGPRQPAGAGSLWFGSFGSSKGALKFGGESGKLNYLFDVSRFDTNGYRDHSAATRDQLNGKFKYTVGPDATLSMVINALDQPDTQDPLGLSKAQANANPRQVDASAITFNTRKSIRHDQEGLIYEQRVNDKNTLRVMGYIGHRVVTQFQAFQGGSNTAIDTFSGGVVNFDRNFGGLGLRWTHSTRMADGPLTVVAGVDYDRSKERRKGFTNRNGTAGVLKRDEDDKVISMNLYVQGEWRFSPRWLLSAGLRDSRVNFKSDDHFVIGVNPNDSGTVDYSNTSPVLGVLFQLSPAVNVYANAGRGFETPTFNELFYKPDGTSGLNFALRPSKSNNYEIGVKAYPGSTTRLNLAAFSIDTSDEIVTAASTGGRTSFRNAGKTERQGLELSVDTEFGRGFGGYLAYTYLDAKFKGNTLDGKKLPGVPRGTLYGELIWKHAGSGFATALEARWNGKVEVIDTNADAPAASYTVVNWRAGFEQKSGPWRIKEFLRVDNLFDKTYIGSVIVGDTNKRYYETAPGRNYVIGVNASYQF